MLEVHVAFCAFCLCILPLPDRFSGYVSNLMLVANAAPANPLIMYSGSHGPDTSTSTAHPKPDIPPRAVP